MQWNRLVLAWAGIAALILSVATTAAAREPVVAGGGSVNLPYQIQDSRGDTWMVYQSGYLQQQGPMPIYSQGAMLMINNATPNMRSNMAQLDSKTGEVIFDGLRGPNGLTVTRRILINRDGGYVRYIDVFHNRNRQDQTAQIIYRSHFNYGIESDRQLTDPRKKNPMAWIGQTPAQRSIVEMYAGRNVKIAPTMHWPQGNNYMQATFSLVVPAGKQVALAHIHTTVDAVESGEKFVHETKESALLAGVDKELRKLIVNFATGLTYAGDIEILRGETSDVVELRSGDQLKGTLQQTSYKLTTFYGPVELPVDRVVGIINTGSVRPRQLVVTVDGEMFGGKLEADSLPLQLNSGQTTQIPLNQITRVGYRKRPGEPEEWLLNRPMLVMQSGDRINVQLPAEPLSVATRYGVLQLPPKSIAAISFHSEEHGAHQIQLTDGSRFTGLVNAPTLQLQLATTRNGQAIAFPTGSMSRLQYGSAVEDVDPDAPLLKLTNGDEMVGALSGQLKLDTTFDTIQINASQIKELKHVENSLVDVQISLWDDALLSGQLQEAAVACQLMSGAVIQVPVTLIAHYHHPLPQVSDAIVQQIHSLVKELNADDWRQRERAQEQLVAMGPSAIGVLKSLRNNQPPEAQQRIDAVLRQLQQDRTSDSDTRGVPVPSE